ncbi:hypothetical protein ANCCAN_07055 [Ancylostoma caninum]|uniref:Uncharacterized protein n=1 Tax=Ancylostoma caninum TaxID=29170 RepID=A0A368GR92_ANCCA|nr:hypothetical protein ANCCAN_07055 [Ancylostoma caninum]
MKSILKMNSIFRTTTNYILRKTHRARKKEPLVDEMLNESVNSTDVDTTENKIPILKGIVLLLLIAACLLAAAVVVALFLWILSKKLPSIREGNQDLIDEKNKQSGEKRQQNDPKAAETEPNLMRRTNLNRAKSYGLNAVYTPPQNSEQKSPTNASADAKLKEEHLKVEKKVVEEKPEWPGITKNPERFPSNVKDKVIDTEPLMPKKDMKGEESFTASDKSKMKLGDAPIEAFGNEVVQDDMEIFTTASEEFPDMRQMKGNAAEFESSPSAIRRGSRREDRKIAEIFDRFEQ